MKVNYDEPVQNLPDAYDKSVDSNNNKLFLINKNTTDDIKTALSDVFNVLNINNASGRTLDDVWGGRLHLKRGGFDDDMYILRLKFKMMQNIACGYFSDLIEALAFVLKCDTSDIHIVESETKNGVIVKDMPISLLQNAGFTIYQINDLINRLLSVGVEVLEFTYEKKALLSAHICSFAASERKYQSARIQGPSDTTVQISLYTGGFAAHAVKRQAADIEEPHDSITGFNQCVGGFAASIVKYQTISI